MNTSYNQIAGQSEERLAALSDGIFAVEMTLLASAGFAFIVVVQLNYAVAPRFWRTRKAVVRGDLAQRRGGI